jgi:hypothetical protein
MIRETRLGGCAMQNRQCIWFQLSYWHAFSFFTFALLHGSMVSLLDKATLPYKLLGTGSVVTNVICGLGIIHCICSLLAHCAELKAITLKWLNLCLLCTLSLVHSSWFGCVSHNFRFFLFPCYLFFLMCLHLLKGEKQEMFSLVRTQENLTIATPMLPECKDGLDPM